MSMETVKEKLARILDDYWEVTMTVEDVADVLISNGVTIATDTNDKWVSVDEPPKEDGRYLLLFEDGSMCDAIYEVKRGQFGIYEQYWNAVNGWFKVWQKEDPTHWMPKPNIPEPPKEV